MRTGDTDRFVDLQLPLKVLQRGLARRGGLGDFLKLEGIESQRLLEPLGETQGGPDERNLN